MGEVRAPAVVPRPEPPTFVKSTPWRTASGPVTDVPRWPRDELHVDVDSPYRLVVRTGARFFTPHEIRAEIVDGAGASERTFGTISRAGWAVLPLERPLADGETYTVTLALLDAAGHASVGRPTFSFVMPRFGVDTTLVLAATHADPPLPAPWHQRLYLRLVLFVLDPFVLGYLAARLLARRRSRPR